MTTTTTTTDMSTVITFRGETWMGAREGWSSTRSQTVASSGADAEEAALVSIRSRMASYIASATRDGKTDLRTRIVKVIEVSGLHEEVVE